MSLKDCMNDKILIVKSNNKQYGPIKAYVTWEDIITYDVDIRIDAGDLLIRKLSNGGEETYTVLDPRFSEGDERRERQYRLIVRKKGIIKERPSSSASAHYHIEGDHNRFNLNSTDNSVNIHYFLPIQEQIEKLLDEIRKLNDEEYKKSEWIEIVEAIRNNAMSEKPSKTVIKTLLGALPPLASLLSIGVSLISMFR